VTRQRPRRLEATEGAPPGGPGGDGPSRSGYRHFAFTSRGAAGFDGPAVGGGINVDTVHGVHEALAKGDMPTVMAAVDDKIAQLTDRTQVRYTSAGGQADERNLSMPTIVTLGPFDSDELSQIHVALAARIEDLERVQSDDPDAVPEEFITMVRKVDRDVVEARRKLV